MDAHGAHHLIGFMGAGGQRHQMRGDRIDGVAVLQRKDALFLHEHPVAQAGRALGLEPAGDGADVIARTVELPLVKLHHARISCGSFSIS